MKPSGVLPLISIITVVYNAKDALQSTIKSILAQTNSNYEYIVIDGGSTDGTVDVIKEYKQYIAYWISEPDKGLYDAMNKALRVSKGKYIWFMNAGDLIYDNNVIENIAKLYTADTDVFYGETVMIDRAGTVLGNRRLKTPENLTYKSLSMGMLVCHQSFIAKRTCCDYYNTNYKIAADIEWMINTLKNSKKIVNTLQYITRFKDDGLSKKNIKRSLTERFKIMIHHYGIVTTLINHLRLGTNFFIYVLKNRRF